MKHLKWIYLSIGLLILLLVAIIYLRNGEIASSAKACCPDLFNNKKDYAVGQRFYDYYNINLFYEYRYPLVDNTNDEVFPIPEADKNINYAIDEFYETDEFISITGWAFIKDQDVENAKIYLVLNQDTLIHAYPTKEMRRDDVSTQFETLDLNFSGFSNTVNKRDLAPGSHNLGILIVKDGVGRELTMTEYATDLHKPLHIDFPEITNDITYHIDYYADKGEEIKIEGWAIISGESSISKHIYVCLVSEDSAIVFNTIPVWRKDVTANFKHANYNNSGFKAILKKNLKVHGYDLGIMITDKNRAASAIIVDHSVISSANSESL